MTKLLEKALEAISKLPDNEQDSLAAIIMEEIASEKRWDEAFSRTQDALGSLAKEALEEFGQDKTEPLDS
jgi:hypothetical protein